MNIYMLQIGTSIGFGVVVVVETDGMDGDIVVV